MRIEYEEEGLDVAVCKFSGREDLRCGRVNAEEPYGLLCNDPVFVRGCSWSCTVVYYPNIRNISFKTDLCVDCLKQPTV